MITIPTGVALTCSSGLNYCVSQSHLREEYIFEHRPRNGGARGDATSTSITKQVPILNGQAVGSHTDATSQVVGGAPQIFMPQIS